MKLFESCLDLELKVLDFSYTGPGNNIINYPCVQLFTTFCASQPLSINGDDNFLPQRTSDNEMIQQI